MPHSQRIVERVSTRRAATRRVIAALLMCTASWATAREPLADRVAAPGDAVLAALRDGDLAAIERSFDRAGRGITHDRFVAAATVIAAHFGTLGACRPPDVHPNDDLTIADYPCDFASRPMTVRVVWTDGLVLTGLFVIEPPPPGAPLPAGLREIAVVVGADGWALPGTLLLPAAAAKPPVALLVAGSGPNDRDETIGPNRPFRDLAVGLATHGIGSLRYDKRTRVFGRRYAADPDRPTLDDEVVDDAVAALRGLAARGDLGPLFVVGHSEGAWLAPRIAARAQRSGIAVAGVVMLAGNLTPLADLLVTQYAYLAALPRPTATREQVDDAIRRRDAVHRLVERGAAAPGEPLPFGGPPSYWLDAGGYDPARPLLAQPDLPALLTFGERDYQVPIDEMASWSARLDGRPGTTIVAFPRLNHLLIEGDGPMSPGEYAKPGHVSSALIDRVGRWIDARSLSR